MRRWLKKDKWCVCKRFYVNTRNIYEVSIVRWAKCDKCGHWVNLRYCTSTRVVRRNTPFQCPCCENLRFFSQQKRRTWKPWGTFKCHTMTCIKIWWKIFLPSYCFLFKVALGVCFALKSWKEYLLLFTYLITLGKDVTLSLITKFKTTGLWVIYL